MPAGGTRLVIVPPHHGRLSKSGPGIDDMHFLCIDKVAFIHAFRLYYNNDLSLQGTVLPHGVLVPTGKWFSPHFRLRRVKLYKFRQQPLTSL